MKLRIYMKNSLSPQGFNKKFSRQIKNKFKPTDSYIPPKVINQSSVISRKIE